jgi:hypothetical protein
MRSSPEAQKATSGESSSMRKDASRIKSPLYSAFFCFEDTEIGIPSPRLYNPLRANSGKEKNRKEKNKKEKKFPLKGKIKSVPCSVFRVPCSVFRVHYTALSPVLQEQKISKYKNHHNLYPSFSHPPSLHYTQPQMNVKTAHSPRISKGMKSEASLGC